MNRIRLAGLTIAAVAMMGALTGASPQVATPKAYLIAQINVKDAALFRDYAPQVQPTLAPFGGRFLARGGATVGLEGAAPADRIVVIEFPSLAAAKAHWNSPAYQAITPIRHAASEGTVFIVEGVVP